MFMYFRTIMPPLFLGLLMAACGSTQSEQESKNQFIGTWQIQKIVAIDPNNNQEHDLSQLDPTNPSTLTPPITRLINQRYNNVLSSGAQTDIDNLINDLTTMTSLVQSQQIVRLTETNMIVGTNTYPVKYIDSTSFSYTKPDGTNPVITVKVQSNKKYVYFDPSFSPRMAGIVYLVYEKQ